MDKYKNTEFIHNLTLVNFIIFFIYLYINSLQGLIYHLPMQKLRHLPTKRRNAKKKAGMRQKRFVVLKRHRLEFKFCHGRGV